MEDRKWGDEGWGWKNFKKKGDIWKEKRKVNEGYRMKRHKNKLFYNVCSALWFGNAVSIISFYPYPNVQTNCSYSLFINKETEFHED